MLMGLCCVVVGYKKGDNGTPGCGVVMGCGLWVVGMGDVEWR